MESFPVDEFIFGRSASKTERSMRSHSQARVENRCNSANLWSTVLRLQIDTCHVGTRCLDNSYVGTVFDTSPPPF